MSTNNDDSIKGLFQEGGDFSRACNIEPGMAADHHGATFVEVTPLENGQIHIVVSDGNEFDKDPDDLVFAPKDP